MIKLLEGKSNTANTWATLKNLKGEKIVGVLNAKTKKYEWDNESSPLLAVLVFESGYSFWLRSNGAFWVENVKDTKKIIGTEINRRDSLIDEVKEIRDVFRKLK